MALRIGFDLDGVVADMEAALIREAQQLFGAAMANRPARPDRAAHSSMSDIMPSDAVDNAPLQHELHLTTKQRRQLWHHVAQIDGFWESLEEIEAGSVARLALLAQQRLWEVIFLTRRPATAGATAQVQSQRWLEAKGFRMPSVFVVTSSRGLIASALTLDIVVDDTPENCVDVASDSRARTIGLFRNQAVPQASLKAMGIHIVQSTEECLDLLVDIDASLEPRTEGALERVMRTLGLKQSTSA